MNKRNNLIYHLFSLGWIVLIWIFFSSPYFLGRGIPYPSAQLVNSFAPWVEYDEYKGPEKNNAMPDVIDQLFPWKHFTIESYKSGHLPLWNPNSFAGNYHIGTYQPAIFSPINLLFFILPFIDAWSFAVLLQPLIAGVGMYLYAYHRMKSFLPAVVSSVSFMFCGFITAWMPYTTLSLAISVLPLVLLGLDKINKRISWWTLLVVGSVLFSFLAGHFQISIYLLVFSFWYVVFLYTLDKEKFLFFQRLFSLGVGVGLAFIQLIPSVLHYTTASRSSDFFEDGGIPYWYMLTSVLPDFFGNPAKRNDWVGHYAEWASFIGINIVLFALLTYFKRKDKIVRFFIISTFINLLFALETPILTLMGMVKIPVLSTSYPTRVIVLASFCVCLLGGFGVKYLLENIQEKKKFIQVVGGYLISLLLFIGIAFFFLPSDKGMIALRNSVIPLAFLTGVISCIGGYLFIPKENVKKLFLFGIVFLISLESLLFAKRWVPFEPREKVYPQTPVISAIQKNIGDGRIYGSMGNQIYSYYNIPSLEGYDPLYIERYGEFIRASDLNSDFGLLRSVITIPPKSKNTEKLLSFLGVTMIYQPKSYIGKLWGYAPTWETPEKFKVVFEDDRVQVFSPKETMERAKLFCEFEVISEDKKLLSRFFQTDFNYKEVLLFEKPPERVYGELCQTVDGTVQITEITSDSVVIEVESSSPALLFLSDTHFPTWKARVNGDETQIYRADYAFRAVEVPKGKSRVVFSLSLFP